MMVRLKRVFWRNSLSGKAMVMVKDLQGRMFTCCFSNFPDYQAGITLKYDESACKVEHHKKWGDYTVVDKWELVFSTIESGVDFLSIGLGLPIKDAEKIVDLCHGNLYRHLVLEDGIAFLKSVGMTEQAALILTDKVKSMVVQKEILDFLTPYGGNYTTMKKIFHVYGTDSLRTIKANPYVMTDYGWRIDQADAIAKSLGIGAISDIRLDAVVRAILKAEKMAGHTYALPEQIVAYQDKIRNNVFPDKITGAMLLAHVKQDKIQRCYNSYYLKKLYFAEVNTAKQILRLQNHREELEFDDAVIDLIEAECGIKYAPQQREAFTLLKHTGVAILTGGPGTGKTTSINGLLMAYERQHPNAVIKLCAPTGRAAQRITESTGREAETIHRLLEYRPFGNTLDVGHNKDNPINADVLVVDESSMLDIELASLFFDAIRNDTLVLIVGDINQLPSVGAGDVLHDMIKSGVIPTVQLKTVYRQAGTSPIVANANAINEGKKNFITNDDFKIDFYDSDSEIANAIENYLKENYDETNPFGIQVLVPSRVGDAGLNVLNTRLQAILNPRSGGVQYGKNTFKIGDKIILTQNNYTEGYFNGDIGKVIDIDESLGAVTIETFGPESKTLILSKELLDDLMLAYAMTIHKSQGSEFPEVIVVMPSRPASMLKRNLFYTGVTRAKKKVWVTACKGSIEKALKNTDTGQRRTNLISRLQNDGAIKVMSKK